MRYRVRALQYRIILVKKTPQYMIGVGFIYIFLKILKGWKDYSNIKIRC